MPKPVNGIVYGPPTFKPGTAFIVWDVTIETGRMQSTDSPGRDGNKKVNRLSLLVPKSKADLSHMFRLMENDEFIVLYVENGRQKIFGQLHAPAQFTSRHDTGSAFADRNAYECQFYYEGPDNIFFYNGTSGTPPVGTAPAIVQFNGVPIASLTPGQVFNIQSEFGFTNFFTTS